MNDLLTRAWSALTPEQRPNGMEDCCYHWGERDKYDGYDSLASDPDFLTAAVLAIEAIKGGDK